MEKLTQAQIVDSINNKVIEGLTSKGLKWFKPFKDDVTGSFFAVSAYGKPYAGFNQFILSATALQNGWVNKWYTFAHIQKCNGLINKGEKATPIYLWQVNYKVEVGGKTKYYPSLASIPEGQRDIATKSFFLKTWLVWSISQTNLPHDTPNIEGEEPTELGTNVEADKILTAWSNEVKLIHSGIGRAYYSPKLDQIHMPNKTSKQWQCEGDYYKVYFHEAIHSTGHLSRLDRLDKMASFGSEEYSKEELTAEIGALYLEAITGITTMIDDFKNSQAYINGWIKAIKDDKNLIMNASSKASKAVELILSKV